MLIGELCNATNLGRDTIRYYERMGLLVTQRRRNSYKDYPEDSVTRLRFIKEMQTLGFTLNEIREQLGGFQDGGGPTCGQMAPLVTAAMASLDARIRALQDQKERLAAFFKECSIEDSSKACQPVSRALREGC